ncbi:MAG TPA: UDP-N-acetylglucosamine 1-carboxyvinyltransferase [Desulfobacteria bacterium]|nr:UDP-N-acetylglucosamine 1-carboxyvinyltransferase [Desulfobacteria bacterium]
MDIIKVKGGTPLKGKVAVSGAKNAVLPIIAASIMAGSSVRIEDVPWLTDVETICQVIASLGAEVKRDGSKIAIDPSKIDGFEAPHELVSKMRASIVVMGALLARVGRARISHPGGCAIGSRPINLHLKGLEALGAEIRINHGYLEAQTKGLTGARVYLDYPSVGATENIMMAASLAKGTSVIENAAQEPELVDLANFINEMGGKVRGAGTNIIKIEGVNYLDGATHCIVPDRIEAGSYLIAGAVTGGDVLVENIIADHIKPVIAKLRESGAEIIEEEAGLRVIGHGALNGIEVKTQVHPGFPTDLQAPMMALATVANGTSIITETVFENRFMHVEELNRMGANIRIEGRAAIVDGTHKLAGAPVKATDLRAGAALVIAGLVAEGETTIENIYHIDRGYEHLVEKLQSLGASIERCSA